MNSTIDGTLSKLYGTLDRVSRRAQLTASNLANVDTPGYRAKRVAFEQRADGPVRLQRSRPGHLALGGGTDDRGAIYEPDTLRIRQDGNNVDVDREMADLARTQGRFTAAAQIVRKRFAMLRYAASDGRR